jgi:hypothetical protein
MLIYDIDNSWPGSTNDARIWRTSEVKEYLEQAGTTYFIAGDSAYPISTLLVKPYSVDEAGRDNSKLLFNQRLSGLRTAMTENVYGVWKKRMACLNQLRCHLPLAQVKYTVGAQSIEHLCRYLAICQRNISAHRRLTCYLKR